MYVQVYTQSKSMPENEESAFSQFETIKEEFESVQQTIGLYPKLHPMHHRKISHICHASSRNQYPRNEDFLC